MNPALWAAILAAQKSRLRATSSNATWWASKTKPTMPVWPQLLLWLIQKRTQRRLIGQTWVKFDDWLWDRYFSAIEKDAS